MDMYFSGHLHLYERTKPICPNGTIQEDSSGPYSMQCPIYTVEGAAGNDDYVQI